MKLYTPIITIFATISPLAGMQEYRPKSHIHILTMPPACEEPSSHSSSFCNSLCSCLSSCFCTMFCCRTLRSHPHAITIQRTIYPCTLIKTIYDHLKKLDDSGIPGKAILLALSQRCQNESSTFHPLTKIYLKDRGLMHTDGRIPLLVQAVLKAALIIKKWRCIHLMHEIHVCSEHDLWQRLKESQPLAD